jgi:hypothetical protein
LCILLSLLCGGCGPAIDLKQALQVTDLSGGWYDAGIVNGKNKLVPSVTFRLRKNTDQEIRYLSLNVVFRRITGPESEEALDDVYLQRVEFTEGNQTAPLVMRPETGYTGDPPQSRREMLQNSEFRDVRAVISAKQSGPNWVELARYEVPRQLLTQ